MGEVEMQQLEQENSTDLLGGDLPGSGTLSGGRVANGGGIAGGGGGADLLRFDHTPAPVADPFGASPAKAGSTNGFGGGANLLGFQRLGAIDIIVPCVQDFGVRQ